MNEFMQGFKEVMQALTKLSKKEMGQLAAGVFIVLLVILVLSPIIIFCP